MPQAFNCTHSVQVTDSFGCNSTFHREAVTPGQWFLFPSVMHRVCREQSGSEQLLAQQGKFKASHVKC